MTVQDMHYDFKKKLNKIDSQSQRNLLVPEIDWVLNEAQEVFIDLIAEPRREGYLGFEINQKAIDDLKSLVETDKPLLFPAPVDNTVKISFPIDYRYYLNSHVFVDSEVCPEKRLEVFVRRHDEVFHNDPFNSTSYDWEVINARFSGSDLTGPFLILYLENGYYLQKVNMSYIRQPKYIHNAQDFSGNEYKLPNGLLLTGRQNCELPPHTHREIVDIAVMITTGEIQAPDMQTKIMKTNLNNIKLI